MGGNSSSKPVPKPSSGEKAVMGGNSSSKPVPKPSSGEKTPPKQRSPDRSVKRRLSATPPPSPKKSKVSQESDSNSSLRRSTEDGRRLCENDIPAMLEALAGRASKWRDIGSALGFTPNELDEIQAKPKLFDSAPNSWLSEMLSQWVQWTPETRGKRATLQNLAAALRKQSVALAVVAEEIMKVFSGDQPLQDTPTVDKSDPVRQPESNDQHEGLCRLIPPDPSAFPYEHYAYYLRCYYTHVRKPTGKWPDIEVREYINLAVISCKTQGSHAELEEFRKATIHGSIDDILENKEPLDFSDLFKPNLVKGKAYPIKRILMEGAPGIGKSTMSWEVCQKWGNRKLFQEFSLVVMLRFRDPWVQKVTRLDDLFLFPDEPELQRDVAKQTKRMQGKGLLLILDGFDEAPSSLREEDSIFSQLFQGLLLPNATVMMTSRPSASVDLRSYCKDESSRRVEILGFGKKEINEYIESRFNTYKGETQKENFFKYLELYPHIYNMMYVPLNCAIVTHVYQSCKTDSTIVPQTMTQLYTALVKTLLLRYLKETEYKHFKIRNFSDLPKPVLEKFHQVCKLAYDGIDKGEIIFSELSEDFDSLGLMQSTHELFIDEGALVSYNFLHLTIQEYVAAYHLSLLDNKEQIDFLENSHNKRMSGRSLGTYIPGFLPNNSTILKQQSLFTLSKFLAGLTTCKLDGAQCTSPIHEIIQRNKRMRSPISVDDLHLLFELHNVTGIFESTDSIVFKPQILSLFDYYVLGYCIGAIDCNWEVNLADFVESAGKIEMLTKGLVASVQQHATPSRSRKGETELYLDISKSKSFSMLLNMGGDMHSLENLLQQFPGLNTVKTPSDIKQIASKAGNASRSQRNKRFGFDKLIKSFHLFPKLTLLEVAKRHRRSIDHEDIIELIEHLPECVTSLAIKDNTIEEEVCLVTGDLLASSSCCIQFLDLSYNLLKPRAMQFIIDGLSKNTSLEELFISGSELSSSNATSLATVLENNTTLTILDLSDCKVDGNSELAKSLELNTGLKTLDLTGFIAAPCEGDNPGIAALSSALLRNKTLQHLTLAECCLEEKDTVLLAKGIEGNSTLETLDIQENSLCDKGAAALSKHLENSTSSLKVLHLQQNQIGDEGASAIGNALISNSTLEVLNLEQNCIGAIGAAAIGKALENCESALKLLNLSENQIGDEGATAIGKGLINNSKLEALKLDENSIGNEGTVAIAEGLGKNSSVKILYLQHNSVGDQGAIALAKAIRNNASLKLELHRSYSCMTEEGRSILSETIHEQFKAEQSQRLAAARRNIMGSTSHS